MPAGTVALRLIRRAFHRIDVALTSWIAPLPKDTSQADPADLVGFRTFFRRLPSDAAARDYMHVHLPRLVRTMTLVPKPAGVRRALELGSYMQMTPALYALCGYPEAFTRRNRPRSALCAEGADVSHRAGVLQPDIRAFLKSSNSCFR